MRFPLFLLVLAVLPLASVRAIAADINGYTAQYECRAGNPNCDVDVAALGNRPCDQTIGPSASWSSINWSLSTICIAPGDHTGKGTLTIPQSASGTPGNFKVLRYSRPGDNDDDPWKQSASNSATLSRLVVSGSFWVIQRLAFPSLDQNVNARIFVSGSVSNVIVNRVLVEGMLPGFSNAYDGIYMDFISDHITIQNSVVRNSWGKVGAEPMGITAIDGTNIRIVNNEVYDWSAHIIQIGRNEGPTMSGFVLENNDIYLTAAMYTPDGRTRAKSNVSIKAGGTSNSPGRIIHNRIWGSRVFDASLAGIVAGEGSALIVNGPTTSGLDYVLIENNIVFDNQQGVVWINGNNQNHSLIGNILYKFRTYYAPQWWSHAVDLEDTSNTEIYLNTIIDAPVFTISAITNDIDIRCNVLVASGSRQESTVPPVSSVADDNAFYGASLISFNGQNSNIQRTLQTRSSSTSYSLGQVVQIGIPAQCTSTDNSACFLYLATQSGSSAPSLPTTCTTLGCQFTDGSVTWKAIRGPYAFWSKLRTSPETVTIPYARPNSLAPEARLCPADYSARFGIGVNN